MTDSSAYAETFKLIDTDQDGRIDADEFHALMNALGGGSVDADVASSMFGAMDGDADGRISLDELAAYLSTNPA